MRPEWLVTFHRVHLSQTIHSTNNSLCSQSAQVLRQIFFQNWLDLSMIVDGGKRELQVSDGITGLFPFS